MVGDIQEPFRLSFQVDSIHSGSISFGRFELESLSWERRSSFSHNRYLEDVEKYARPGSVTEKKAYFEAHFRRKALLGQAASESQVEKHDSVREADSYETGTHEENRNGTGYLAEGNSNGCHFDESSEGSYSDKHVKGTECELGLAGYEHPERGASFGDVHVRSHFDESPNDSGSPGVRVHQGGEFKEESGATAHSDSQSERAPTSVDLEDVVRCCDKIEHDVEVEIIPDEPTPEVPGEGDISYRTVAMDSMLEITQTRAAKSRAEEKTKKLEPADRNSVNSENVIRCFEREENFKGESESDDALMDNIVHDAEVEMMPTGEAPEISREECNSQCAEETKGSALKVLQTRAPKPRAEEKTTASRRKSKIQSSVSLTRRPEVKKGTAQSSDRRERQTPLRARTQKPLPQLNRSSLQSSHGISKKENPPSLKGKTPPEIRSEKDLKTKRGVPLQPSTPETTEPRRRPSTPGIKQIPSSTKEIQRCAMNSSFRSERGEKVKEIKRSSMTSSFKSERGEKIREERKKAEATQSLNKPNFKAKPMPSFYYETVPQGSSRNKPRVVSNSSRPSKGPSKSLHIGNQTGAGSIPRPKTGNIQPLSPSRSEGSRASLGRRNCDVNSNSKAHLLSNTKRHTVKATQTKVVASRK